MNIFKDDYLETKFINRNYIGRPGWKCEYVWTNNKGCGGRQENGTLLLMCDSSSHGFIKEEGRLQSSISIPKFASDSIPVGELCWVSLRPPDQGANRWSLEVKTHKNKWNSKYYYIVPFLIAETEEQAKLLKDWNSDEH